jgi:hypothetical protein
MAGYMARKRIGELLLERGAITPAQLEAALAAQRERRQRLGAVLVAQGAITDTTLAQVLSEALGLPAVALGALQPEWSAVHMLRARFCEQHELFPYALESLRGRRHLLVAMSDPLNVPAVEEIEFTTGLKVAARVAPLSEVRAAILRYYHKVTPATAEAPDGQLLGPGGVPLRLAAQDEELPTLDPEALGEEPAADGVVEGIIVGEALPVGETTERNALAALIERREAQRREARARAPAAPPFAPARPGAVATGSVRAQGPGPGGAPGAVRGPVAPPAAGGALQEDLAYLLGGPRPPREASDVEELERKFWALMRIMARKGLLTREEFTRELDDAEEPPPPPSPGRGR